MNKLHEYNVRVYWNHRGDLTSIIKVEAIDEDGAMRTAMGICGEFWFEQGGKGDMPMPDDAYVISLANLREQIKH